MPQHPLELKRLYGLVAKKTLGQNFLIHQPTLRTIAQKVLQHSPKTILEIGPGPGGLSQLLAGGCKQFILVEKDRQFENLLNETLTPLGPIILHIADFLETNLDELLTKVKPPIVAVGNLPYNASVAILKHLLSSRHHFSHLYLMFQKEVADRLVSQPNTKTYGSLSLFVQMIAYVKKILPIPPSAFDPRPKIHSSVVEIIPLLKPKFDVNLEDFETLIQAAFAFRRKTLQNALEMAHWKNLNKMEIALHLQERGIVPSRRAETLSIEEFAKIIIG
jgi:16S rRNA (adenine1518-N6/adenine1519-N6)-dimethyltransferase